MGNEPKVLSRYLKKGLLLSVFGLYMVLSMRWPIPASYKILQLIIFYFLIYIAPILSFTVGPGISINRWKLFIAYTVLFIFSLLMGFTLVFITPLMIVVFLLLPAFFTALFWVYSYSVLPRLPLNYQGLYFTFFALQVALFAALSLFGLSDRYLVTLSLLLNNIGIVALQELIFFKRHKWFVDSK